MTEWKEFEVVGKHYAIKNKKVRAIYVTDENADEVAMETKCFTKFNENCVCTGFLSFQRIPSWLININPRGRIKKYVFVSEVEANRLLNSIN